MTQSPPIVPVTVPPTKLQTDGVVLLKVTDNPELELATQLLVPLTGIEVGAQDNEIVWSSLVTTTVAGVAVAGA